VRIALDDFGVGQSLLACRRDLPLDALKLDRGFITSLASSRQAAAIVYATRGGRSMDAALLGQRYGAVGVRSRRARRRPSRLDQDANSVQ
jgi:predicted signal transduction protein with EAL and GGDEF domain